MKSLSLATPLMLVTVGLPGAGKSFFARQFSETFGAPVVSKEYLQHILKVDAIPGKAEQEKLDQLAYYQLGELLKTQKSFIVDGFGATRAERVELRKQAKDHGYNVLLIWVQTDIMTSQYRSMKRSKQRQDDTHKQSISAEDFIKISKRFHPPLANETNVVISGKHTYATQARIVLKKLVAPRIADVPPRSIIGHEQRVPTDRNEDGPPASRRNVLIR